MALVWALFLLLLLPVCRLEGRRNAAIPKSSSKNKNDILKLIKKN
jgi:hypothetical protein